MTLSSFCPFSASGMITETQYFVGRREELNYLTARMEGVQPTSVNVVGKKRMGKSSLLYHFYQTYEERVNEPKKYVVVYLSLQDVNCQQEKTFYQVVMEKVPQRRKRNIFPSLRKFSADRQGFSRQIQTWHQADILPVLCLDKFEEWLDKPQEFTNDFYDNLRSLMDSNILMLIIASEGNLKRYAEKKGLTSDFFNLGQVLTLNGLTELEAEDLVKLPRGNNSGLSKDKQRLALAWGERNPYKLQLAGLYLWEAEKQGHSEELAREKFLANCPVNKQSQGSKPPIHKLIKPFYWLFWQLPLHLGRLATGIGNNLDDLSNRLLGTFILLVIVFIVFQVLPAEELWKQILEAIK